MIAGTDLVSATLDPHEFLDRLRGRLDRQLGQFGTERFVAREQILRHQRGHPEYGGWPWEYAEPEQRHG